LAIITSVFIKFSVHCSTAGVVGGDDREGRQLGEQPTPQEFQTAVALRRHRSRQVIDEKNFYAFLFLNNKLVC